MTEKKLLRPTAKPDTDLQFKSGNTEANDLHVGHEAAISIDFEEKSIRVHDGLTAGGAFTIYSIAPAPVNPFKGAPYWADYIIEDAAGKKYYSEYPTAGESFRMQEIGTGITITNPTTHAFTGASIVDAKAEYPPLPEPINPFDGAPEWADYILVGDDGKKYYSEYPEAGVSIKIQQIGTTDVTQTGTDHPWTPANIESSKGDFPPLIIPDVIKTPSVVVPTNGASAVADRPTIQLTPFEMVSGEDTHTGTSLRLKAGSVIVWEQVNSAPLNNIQVPANTIEALTLYSLEAKYHGDTGESGWSTVSTFTTGLFDVIKKPSILTPANGSGDVDETPTIAISSFALTAGTDTHTGTSVRVKDNLGDIVWQQVNTTPLNNIAIPAGILQEGSNYSAEAKHHGAKVESAWSEPVSFTTKAAFVPVNAPAGTPFGGGFTAGKIKIGSNTYLLIAAGGAGDSFKKDASTHAWKTANTAVSTVDGVAPATMNDGFANHAALKAAGIALHPAAKWIEDNCNAGAGLGGHKDWYLPSRDELEILYRNFKPNATANSVSTRSASGFGGDGAAFGVNANSVPAGVAYTASNPPVTPLANFKVGGADAFDASTYYWSSSESSGPYAWVQNFNNGLQNYNLKTDTRRVRAVRRVLVS